MFFSLVLIEIYKKQYATTELNSNFKICIRYKLD